MPARTFPDPLPEYVRAVEFRRAEIQVYEALRSQLSAQYSVFYSRPWVGVNPDGTEKEGEADFVVAHPDTGFLVIEVKGGGIERDGKTGEWHTTNRYGMRYPIKDPFWQARRSMHVIFDRLKALPRLQGRQIGKGHAVILPDSTGIGQVNSIDISPEQTACAETMPKLGDWVRERLSHTIGDHSEPLGADGMAALEKLIAGSFQLRVPLARSIAGDYEQIVTVTAQQFALLEFLRRQRRAAVAGTAGSGKTLIAQHKALELASAEPGGRVLLTCFNEPLAAHLRRTCGEVPGLEVMSFHEACRSLAGRAGVDVPSGGHDEAYYETVLPGALLSAVDRSPALKYDAIIVDEGQDFHDHWLEVLQLSLRTDHSIFWVFYDDNQRIYDRPSDVLRSLAEDPVVLRKNVRNTKAIFDKLQPLLGGDPVTPLGPAGRPVEEVSVIDEASVLPRLSALLKRLIEDEGVPAGEIAVLAVTKERLDQLVPGRRISGMSTTDAGDVVKGRICLDTVRRFKGLERQVVILLQPNEMVKPPELLYVALSRAVAHLVMIGTQMPKIAIDHDP